ncbi:uncharacterized protein FOMMEDRAFT_143407 [Fomitiporia mediterranea MF3/22]|uniref:uncharacterized protein n=1 Tax=Fomitiporia mediterranea (strain MF3/22) TaxID=694068 RepID=UPI00044074AC|nr:uncharacterized protein FOMMEDRAFT_143407 [Fomitiporia mediterranea MF3/22]EJC97866.1 hypothetical protein FOMMEDRAFT_143407 [Fomitiporia mediterranea MF3/22]
MGGNEDAQNLEIQALKSIYPDVFFDDVSPKAWKGAARLPEFSIRVDKEEGSDVYVVLNVKFPKAYPTKAIPILSIPQSKGLTPAQVNKLLGAIHAEAQRCLGSEAVFAVRLFVNLLAFSEYPTAFQVIEVAQEWMRKAFDKPEGPKKERSGLSLAIEMQNRALEEEKALREKEELLAREEEEKQSQADEQLLQQIEKDALRKEEMRREERERQKARRRAFSDATEKPLVETSIESFDSEIEISGVRFDTVRLYHGRQECLGTTYDAEPVCDEPHPAITLELHVIVFESSYYKTHPGRKKIDQVENEARRLTRLASYDHVQRVLAVQSNGTRTSQPTRISILVEKKPSLTLKDVLLECDGLREERITSYLMQICTGLRTIHDAGLIHRAICPSSVGLVDHSSGSKIIKLTRVSLYAKLHDLHMSEPFGANISADLSEPPFPDEWLFRETIESPLLYTRCRDIHSTAVLVLQMAMGLDVPHRYPNPSLALLDSGLSDKLNRIVGDMFKLGKKSNALPTAIDIMERLDQRPAKSPSKSITIAPSTSPMQRTDLKTPVARIVFPNNSPQNSYFAGPEGTRKASRWREDWQQLEVLGKGGFGQVVKAKNLMDGATYAVKKIKLKAYQPDNKIYREVNALSRLNHRFIVRYYTTWLEESEPTSSTTSSDSGQGSDDADDQTAGALSSESNGRTTTGNNTPDSQIFRDPTTIDLDELMNSEEAQTSSFPSIHFTSGDVAEDSSDEEESASLQLVERSDRVRAAPMTVRTLYIQMEYVPRQTLKELVAERISEDEAWRLFLQIVDALVHMASLGILHRDIKLTNIFIDSSGNCKVGDFGLATSSLAAVDPSELSPMPGVKFSGDMTLDVGTRLYIAPEILSKRGGSRDKDHSKMDLYSLGIVFFEMNYFFSTDSERIAVIEKMRHPDIHFPTDWDLERSKQKEVIQWLLQHEPARRPTAIQLSQSPLLPPRVEDEYFKAALGVMTSDNNQYLPAVLASLFSRKPRPTGEFLYDYNFPETAILRDAVIEHLKSLFRLHGARDVDVPLLMPLTDRHLETTRQVLLLDTHGDIVALPSNTLLPFARLAARHKTTRIKRYHIGDMYRVGAALAHPTVSSAAIFDVITPDISTGLQAASAEMITLMDECLCTFPNLAKTYQIHVSHSKISEIVLGRLPEKLRESIVDVLQEFEATPAQKRASLQRKGLSKIQIDELEWLYEDYEDVNVPLLRLEKSSSPLAAMLKPYLFETSKAVALAMSSGLYNTVRVQPLMVGRRHDYYKNGVCLEVVNLEKRIDILAVGGRYDHIISQFYAPSVKTKREPFVAVGVQIALERITSAIAAFQRNFLKNNQRSYDYWHARRCDVYIVSFQPGYMAMRYELAALLWRNGIRADLMYETGVSDTDMEGLADRCYNEGILFTLYPKVRAGQREPTEFKVKSILRGTEYEFSKQDLIPWLQQQIIEQKKIDAASSGVTPLSSDMSTSPTATNIKENPANADLQLILPGEGTSLKKQRKTTKQLFFDRAYEGRLRLKSAVQSGALPALAIDVPPTVFDALSRSDTWIADDDAWRAILPGFPTQHISYANQIREAVSRRKSEGVDLLMLFAVKEERMALLNLKGGSSDH